MSGAETSSMFCYCGEQEVDEQLLQVFAQVRYGSTNCNFTENVYVHAITYNKRVWSLIFSYIQEMF